MKRMRYATLPFLITLALGAPLAGADNAPSTGERNELVVFGGISLLDASRARETTIDLGNFPDLPGMPGRPGFGGRLPIGVPPITLSGETSLGSSVLFGARYSRRIKDRLALEADLSVAPSHEFETGGQACVAGYCIGGRPGGERQERPTTGGFAGGLEGPSVTAWHYGAGLAYELTGGDVRPVVILGAGGVSWDGARAGGTDFVLRFGAGLKVLFGRVGARVDVVDHLVLDHFASGETEHDVHATLGLQVRF